MKSQHFTIEVALYALAVLLAVGLRLLNLGESPLQENEASAALYALQLAPLEGAGLAPGLQAPQPAYHTLTWLAFALLGDHNAVARLWPAVAGVLLVMVPFLFRSLLGRPAALLLAFFLALDPGLSAVSRQADGRMLGLSLTLLAAGLAYRRKFSWAGFFLGLALLCGPAVIPGLASLLLALAIAELLSRLRRSVGAEAEAGVEPPSGLTRGLWREALLPAGLAIFALGTLFFRYPRGLSDWAAALPAYIDGWSEPSGVPAVHLLFALLVYQPLGVVFGLSGALRGWLRLDPLYQKIALWFLVSLLLALLYPARQVSDLIWPLVPLLALAALEISPFLVLERGDERIPLGLAALVLLLLTIFWLNLLGLGPAGLPGQEAVLRLVVMLGLLVLIAVSTALIGLGWSWLSAGRGLVWGLCLALGIYGLANVGEIFRSRLDSRQGLWNPFPAAGDVDLLLASLEDLSTWNTGRSDGLDILVAVDSAALRWALRRQPGVTYLPESQVASLRGKPSLLLTRQTQTGLSLGADYRGQDFSWWVYPDWPGPLPPNLVSWIAFRPLPQRQAGIILWARNDLFPGELLLDALGDQAPRQRPEPEEIAPFRGPFPGD